MNGSKILMKQENVACTLTRRQQALRRWKGDVEEDRSAACSFSLGQLLPPYFRAGTWTSAFTVPPPQGVGGGVRGRTVLTPLRDCWIFCLDLAISCRMALSSPSCRCVEVKQRWNESRDKDRKPHAAQTKAGQPTRQSYLKNSRWINAFREPSLIEQIRTRTKVTHTLAAALRNTKPHNDLTWKSDGAAVTVPRRDIMSRYLNYN